MDLKEKLLSTQVIENNEWLDKYINLLEYYPELQDTKGKRSLIENHHIIPECYYEQNNQDIDNSTDNLKTLSFKDHCLAHYYLFKCSKDSKFKASNACAVIMMTSRDNLYKDEKEFIQSLDGFQEARIITREHQSEAIKKAMENPELKAKISEAISKALSGENHFNYGKHLKDSTCALIGKSKLGNTNNLGTRWSEEKKQEFSERKKEQEIFKGFIWINDSKEEFRILPEELNKYLSQGYIKGRLKSSVSNFRVKEGTKLPKTTCNRISLIKKEKSKPHKIYTNGFINIWVYENEEVPEGFYRGFVRNGKSKFETKEDKNIYVKKRDLNKIINYKLNKEN